MTSRTSPTRGEEDGGLTRVFDGSQRKPGNGYTFHGVSIGNQPLIMRLHDSNAHTVNQTRLAVIDQMMDLTGTKGVWVLNRGNDDAQFFTVPKSSEECTLVVQHRESALQPIRVLTSVAGKTAAWIIATYLERWDVENLFRQMKLKYGLESIRVLSLGRSKTCWRSCSWRRVSILAL